MEKSNLKSQHVWPILLIGIGIIIVSGFSIFVFQGWAVVSSYGVEFPPSQELIDKWNSEYFPTATGFSRTTIPFHTVLALLVIIAATYSRESLIPRLGLGRSSTPNWSYPVFMLASPLSWIIGSLMVAYIIGESSAHWIKITDAFNHTQGIDAFVVIAWGVIGASFAEEFFFRGYLLKGLVQRWNPWLCIAISAFLFAAVHGGLDFMLYVFPAGIWYGILTWRTQSIWPAIICHGFENLFVTFMNRYHDMNSAGIWANPSYLAISVLLISVIAMIFAVRLLLNKK